MGSKDESKEIDIKKCMCYYFDDIMRAVDINFSKILLDKKSYKNSYENILICDISYKTFMCEKPWRIRFDEVNGFIKVYNGTRYLVVLFSPGWYDAIYSRIRYLISKSSGITDNVNHNFARIRIDSYNSLPVEKVLTFHNVTILIISVVNKNKNNYYYNIF